MLVLRAVRPHAGHNCHSFFARCYQPPSTVMRFRNGSTAVLAGIAFLLGIGIVQHLAGRSTGVIRQNRKLYEMHPVSESPRSKCWVFSHMNKAGGSTIKYMLEPYAKKHNLSIGLYDSSQWQEGTEFAKDFLNTKYTLTWGAYAEGLRPHGGGHCKWFTVFRQ